MDDLVLIPFSWLALYSVHDVGKRGMKHGARSTPVCDFRRLVCLLNLLQDTLTLRA